MEITAALDALSALAQSTRLEAFRILVGRGAAGAPSGELARLLAVPQNTMSAHLAALHRAGLVTSERRSRVILYRADLSRFGELVVFLLSDCCGGHPDVCLPILSSLACNPNGGNGSCRTVA